MGERLPYSVSRDRCMTEMDGAERPLLISACSTFISGLVEKIKDLD